MKKKTKMMTTMGILGACACGCVGAYMYMNKNKKKMQQAIQKYMSYPDESR